MSRTPRNPKAAQQIGDRAQKAYKVSVMMMFCGSPLFVIGAISLLVSRDRMVWWLFYGGLGLMLLALAYSLIARYIVIPFRVWRETRRTR